MNALLPLKSPFPYFGGKSRVADMVWSALGDVTNYVEPFAGSLAVLLSRPHAPRIETVNDMDCMISNFWRAVVNDPGAVADHANWPVNEVDLEARHYWLVTQKENIRDRLGDPEWYDARAAGWWVWGICAWIGGGWCDGTGPWWHDGEKWQKRDRAGRGINRKLPHLGGGRGINRQLPDGGVHAYMAALSTRLHRVRVACGDWSRVCGPSATYKNGLTGVFLDPPYTMENRSRAYSCDCGNVARDVTKWAVENGDNPKMRIIVAGYDGEHGDLTTAGWRVAAWEANGGYGNQGNGAGRQNANKERLWFSPHCLIRHDGADTTDTGLFAARA